MKSVPYACEKPCGHAGDHAGGCGGRLSLLHSQIGKNLLLLLSLRGIYLYQFIQIISSSSISQHLLKIENIIHENILPFEDPNIKFFIIVIMSVNVKLKQIYLKSKQCMLLKCIFCLKCYMISIPI